MSLLTAKEATDEESRVGEFSKLLGRVGSLWALELDRLGFTYQFCDFLFNCMSL